MRFKSPYRFIKRKNSKGKSVYRYRVWDSQTGRRREFTTHQTTRDGAQKYCELLLAAGLLVPVVSPSTPSTDSTLPTTVPMASPIQTFGEFAKNWWGPDCPYCRTEAERGVHLKRTYKELCALRLRLNILPTFSEVRLDAITPHMIVAWRRKLTGGPRVRNTALSTLSTMLKEAVHLWLIPKNPCEAVPPVKETRKKRELLSLQETEQLFSHPKATALWESQPVARRLVRLVTRTGLRVGEAQGLQVNDISWDGAYCWLTICHEWDRKELTTTKNSETRIVPVELEIAKEVFVGCPKKGFAFSEDAGKSPVSYFRLRKHLKKVMVAVGISSEDQKRRGLGLHAFRHFINTRLRGRVADDKVRAIVGHVSKEMTETYTDHDRETLAPAAAALRDVFSEVHHE